jgi:hypothetical protein
MIHRPALGDDAAANRHLLQQVLDTSGPGRLELPPGEHVLADGLRVPAGWTIRGTSSTRLVSKGTTGHPVLHVLGSDVSISDLTLEPPPADPGEHGGDRGTAVTVGEYLYRETPAWIERVDLRRITVTRALDRAANSIAVMGAVRRVSLHDLTIHGGYTGVAVHWGAVGPDVASITGPTYHPHDLSITDLRVRDAIEGFYLSSVHDVRVEGCCLRDVEMAFRLLPGDNTDRFGTGDISSRITVSGVCARWHGPRYAVRVAGWGRSEVDGVVSVLGYRDTVIRDCRLAGTGTGEQWSPVQLDRATGVGMVDIRLSSSDSAPCCALGASA